jgi:hypothetical protein
MAGAVERNDFKLNHHIALACSLSVIFSEKPVSTFRDHALKRRKENAAPKAIDAAGWGIAWAATTTRGSARGPNGRASNGGDGGTSDGDTNRPASHCFDRR